MKASLSFRTAVRQSARLLLIMAAAAIVTLGHGIVGGIPAAYAQTSGGGARADAQDLAVLRRQLLQQVNDARVAARLAPLAPDPALGSQAQKHSDAMAAGATPFSHEGYAERFEAIRLENPTVTSMGENIGFQDAGARDKATSLMGMWMRSASHKKNILGEFTLTGLGVSAGPDGRVYVTQIFCSGTGTASAKKAMESYTDEGALERDIIDLVNRHRASRKLPPVVNDPELRKLAVQHSTNMATGKTKVSHDGFRGRYSDMRKVNPLVVAMGENVATNFPGPNCAKSTVQNWIDSPEHRKNMEGAEFSITGVGVKVGKNGTIYFTQLFAKIAPPTVPPEPPNPASGTPAAGNSPNPSVVPGWSSPSDMAPPTKGPTRTRAKVVPVN